jgi:TolB-like protein/DNA-binding winged helix-turn-helix (wHTH) protein
MPAPAPEVRVIRFGPFEADLHTRELRKHGVRLKLQEQPFQILAMLLQKPGELVTREEIKSKLWPQDTFVDFDHSLNTAISRLRDVLNDTADTPRFVETLPRRGYRFLAPVQADAGTKPETPAPSLQIPADTAAGPHAQTQIAAGPLSPNSQEQAAVAAGNRNWMAAYAVIFIAALVTVTYFAWTKFSVRAQPLDSLAVLPLINADRNPDLEYLGDGIAESVITHLSQVPGLKVLSRNSAFRYRQADIKPRQVAQELGVKALLLGSIRQHGDELRVTVELVDASDERQIWGEDYTRKLANLSGIQSEIAGQVSQRLRLRLADPVRTRIAQQDTANSEAYRFYLRGRYALDKRTNPDILEGLEYFKKAAELDHDFPLAYAGMATSYGLLAFYGGMAPREAYPLEAAAIRKTLELDPNAYAAYVQRAFYREYPKMDLAAAEQDFRHAIELSPESEEPHHGYSLFLMTEGRFEEAVAEAKKVIELDPHWGGSYGSMANVYHYAGRYDEALAETAHAPEHYPSQWVAGLSLEGKKDYPAAMAKLEQTVKLSRGGFADADLAHTYAVAGRRQDAEAILQRLLKQRQTAYFSPYKIAAVYAGLGDRAQVLRWLNIAADEEDPWLNRINIDPVFQEYRARPEMVQIHQKMIALAKAFPD